MGTNILTGDFTINGTNATDVYTGVITDDNLAEGNISTLIEKRVNDVLFSGKSKAINGYNTVLSYAAAEAVLNVITQTAIKTSSSGTETPDRIDADFSSLSVGGNLISSGVDELNLVDGSIAGTVVNSKAVIYGSSGEVNATTLQIGGTPITSSAEELNLVDGSIAGTIVNSKAVIYGSSGEVNATTLQIGGTPITSTATELNILSGVTATTDELNYLDITTLGTSQASKVLTADSNGDVTIGNDLTITGNLTVNGTTTTVSSTNTVISDNLLELNSGAPSNANDCGIIIERGSTGDNAIIYWDETNDEFVIGTTTATASSTGTISATPGTLNIDTLKISGTAITATAQEINVLDADTTATSTTVVDEDRVVYNDNGTMIQVAMSDIKTYTNVGLASYSTVDRSSATQSETDPTTLNDAITDIYAKLRAINTYLVALSDNITVTNSSDSTVSYPTLDFDNTA